MPIGKSFAFVTQASWESTMALLLVVGQSNTTDTSGINSRHTIKVSSQGTTLDGSSAQFSRRTGSELGRGRCASNTILHGRGAYMSSSLGVA